MWDLTILWGVVAVAGLAALVWLPGPKAGSPLAKWRSVAAGAFFVGAVGTVLLGRVDPDLHVCEATTTTTVTDPSTSTTVETVEGCVPLLDIAHVALLMVPIVALLAPALSEFTIAGLFGAKIREVAAEEAERKTSVLLVTHEFGDSFRSALRASETGQDLGDLPSE